MALVDHLHRLPPVQAIYTDLDGTLLGRGGALLSDEHGNPSLDAAEALVAARRAGIEVVPVSGRRARQLEHDMRMLGLRRAIAEVGVVIIDGREHRYEWGACPRDLGRTPRQALEAAGAVDTLLDAFPGTLRRYQPWDTGREGGVLLHGLVDVETANRALEAAGAGWAELVDNGRTGGWPELEEVRAYHLIPRGTGKAVAVADDLRERGVDPQAALAIGDSVEDATMATAVGTYVMVGNGHGTPGGNRFAVSGRNGAGFAEAVAAVLARNGARPTA